MSLQSYHSDSNRNRARDNEMDATERKKIGFYRSYHIVGGTVKCVEVETRLIFSAVTQLASYRGNGLK